MKRMIAVIVFFVILGYDPARSQDIPSSAYQKACEYEQEDSDFCVGFVTGFLAGSHIVAMTSSALQKRRYGVDGFEAYKEIRGFCFPESVTTEQIMKVYLLYLEENPEKVHIDVATTMLLSLRENFPCRE